MDKNRPIRKLIERNMTFDADRYAKTHKYIGG